MSYWFQLNLPAGGRSEVYSSFAEASQAIATSLTSDDEPWELVRNSDEPGSCTSVLFGAGPRSPGAGHTRIMHYPPG